MAGVLMINVQCLSQCIICCQELLSGGGTNLPRTAHEVIALLACRLARWDDRLEIFEAVAFRENSSPFSILLIEVHSFFYSSRYL